MNCGASLVHQEPESQVNSDDEPSAFEQAKTESSSEKPPHETSGGEGEDGGFRTDAAMSPRSVYRNYDLYRRFFREARDGLVGFAGRLKQKGAEPLTYEDIAPSLLHAQVGFNKVEEYAKVLSTPLPDENTLRQASPMLSDLEQKQQQLLNLLEVFSEKLEAAEGQEHFKSEFARWHTKLKSHTGEVTLQAGNADEANTLWQRFRNLPSIPKIIIVGLLAVVLLVLLSPVMRVVAITVFGVSILALVVRGVQRKSIREWGIIAVASLVLIPVFGGVSGVFYGSENAPVYSDSGGSRSGSSLVAGVQEGDARFQAYELCHSYFLDELAEEFGTSEDEEEIAYVVGDEIGTARTTKEAAYAGCMGALEEEAINYLPATEENIIQLVKEEGMGEPTDEVWDGSFYVSEGVDMSEIPETDFYDKPSDLDPDHWFLVEYCSPSGELFIYSANPWTADTYQESYQFDTGGGRVC